MPRTRTTIPKKETQQLIVDQPDPERKGPEMLRKPAPDTANQILMEKAVCLTLKFSVLGVTRQVNTENVLEQDIRESTDITLLRVTKRLLEHPSYNAILRNDAALVDYLKRRCLPFPLKQGMFLLPIGLLPEVDARLQQFGTFRQNLVGLFCEAYGEMVAKAKERLGPLFDPLEYPDQATLASAFRFRTNYVNFGLPDSLEAVDSSIYKREREKAERQWAEASDEIRDTLRRSFSELIAHAIDLLTGREDGKKRQFRNGFVERIQEFLDTFNARNLTNDDDLARLVQQAKAVFSGVPIEELRADGNTREAIRTAFGEVKSALTEMVDLRPKRRIRFDKALPPPDPAEFTA